MPKKIPGGRKCKFQEPTKTLSVRIPETVWRWYRSMYPDAVQAILILKYKEFNNPKTKEAK